MFSLPYLQANLSAVVIDSLKVTFFRMKFSLAFLTGTNAIFLAGKRLDLI